MTGYRTRALSGAQELVLRAALEADDSARAAWRSLLVTDREIPPLDAGSFRLLPAVYRNLGANGGDFPAANILRGIYRQAWYRNQVAAAVLGELIERLGGAGVEAMLLKGWACVHLAYGEPGARPMNDADVLVRPKDFSAACDVLGAAGLAAVSGVGISNSGRRVFHAVAFRNSAGIDIDLHHHMLEECVWRGGDTGVWGRSSASTFRDFPVRYPAPEDLLINVCVHGTRWDPVPSHRWMVDAVLLLRRNSIDWDLVVAESRRRRVSIAMEAALREVERFEPVPEFAFHELAGAERGVLERLDFRAQQAGESAASLTARYLTRFCRLTTGRPWVRLTGFPVFLQGMWELDDARQVPLEGVRRLIARLRGVQPARGRQSARPRAGNSSP